jgi:hypothetical protein
MHILHFERPAWFTWGKHPQDANAPSAEAHEHSEPQGAWQKIVQVLSLDGVFNSVTVAFIVALIFLISFRLL